MVGTQEQVSKLREENHLLREKLGAILRSTPEIQKSASANTKWLFVAETQTLSWPDEENLVRARDTGQAITSEAFVESINGGKEGYQCTIRGSGRKTHSAV